MRRVKRLLLLPLFLFACDGADDDVGVDASVSDKGVDTGVDSWVDTGVVDTGTEDTGVQDSGIDPFPRLTCAGISGNCVELTSDQTGDLLDAVNTLSDDTTIVLGAGTFALDTAVTVRAADGVTITGQGIDVTVLDFATQTTQSNGVDVVGDDFSISQLTIRDSKKDALRIEDSTNVRIQFVKTTWTNEDDPNNGSYGIYPVRCTNVLLEDSEASNASDAGLYIGQSINVIVRRNSAHGNVAGLEIENTQYADVYENSVEDNAGGLLIFDLPGNPVIGRDIKIHDNTVVGNNRPNFAPTGTTVSAIPSGTGTFALASRRVEIANNVYDQNNTTDVALLSGLAIQSDMDAWSIPIDMVVGSTVGLVLVETATAIQNFISTEIWVHDNMHSNFGTAPDGADPDARALGALLGLLYYFRPNMGPVDAVLYDGIGEVVDPVMAENNTNVNHMCVENETGGSFAVLDLPKLAAMIAAQDIPSTDDIYQPEPPYAPFDCTGFTGGPIPDVVLPF
jgi:parallel beta-helix repeat protein